MISNIFLFIPTWGNDPIWHNLTNIFQMGWNHQLYRYQYLWDYGMIAFSWPLLGWSHHWFVCLIIIGFLTVPPSWKMSPWEGSGLHPGRLTLNLRVFSPGKGKSSSNPSIFRFYVNLRGCKLSSSSRCFCVLEDFNFHGFCSEQIESDLNFERPCSR